MKASYKTPKKIRDQVAEYQRTHPNYGREWRKKNPGYHKQYSRDHRADRKRDKIETLVYVIESGPYVKVGIAADIKQRLINFRTNCPYPMNLVHHTKKMPRTVARKIEMACHEHLIAHHVQGEWFKAPAHLAIAFINTMSKQAETPTSECLVQLRLVG